MFGYNWPTLHAAINDLPPALLPVAIIFDLLGAALKRESLKAAGFWCLITGVLGGLLAIGSGLMAEDRVAHGDVSHAIMETHETFAIVTAVLFGLLALWRIVRRAPLGKQEQTAFTTAGIIGIGLVVFTAKPGGKLVFEHGLGIDNATMQESLEERAGHHHHPGEADDDHDHDHGAAPDTAHDHDEHQHADTTKANPPAKRP